MHLPPLHRRSENEASERKARLREASLDATELAQMPAAAVGQSSLHTF